MRSYVGFVELYHRRNTDDDDDDGAILLVRTRRWKEVIILKRRCSGIYVMEVVPEDTEPSRCRRSISIGGNAVQHNNNARTNTLHTYTDDDNFQTKRSRIEWRRSLRGRKVLLIMERRETTTPWS
jgi:hypothetical protein